MTFDRQFRPHLFLTARARTFGYTSPKTGGGNPTYPARDYRSHGGRLRSELQAVQARLSAQKQEKDSASAGLVHGGFLAVELAAGSGLTLEGLESARDRASLALVRRVEPRGVCAVVTLGRAEIAFLDRKLEAYLDDRKVRKGGQRANEELVNSIETVRPPELEDFWTGPRPLTEAASRQLWEAWMEPRADGRPLRQELDFGGLPPLPGRLVFPDREVYLVSATVERLRDSLSRLDSLREFRSPATVAAFRAMTRLEQRDWIAEMDGLADEIPSEAPAVCVLDTGVDASHPILKQSFAGSPRVAYLSGWGTDDHHGHGTEMAGLCRHGDHLDVLLSRKQQDPFRYFVESGKILPPPPASNEPRFYGTVTQDVVARVELEAPRRRRIFSLAVTAEESGSGSPSSWSGALDQLASGTGETGGVPRLIACAAGNVVPDQEPDYAYPDTNLERGAEDPAQAWNVITVGAYTALSELHGDQYRDCHPVAPEGDLSPCSRTSMIWTQEWPNKPDLCFEGGNLAETPSGNKVTPPEMGLLTTSRTGLGGPLLVETADTSAATALCASMAARITTLYQDRDLWPETTRALLVHSARWTGPMLRRHEALGRTDRSRNLLRTYGYGVPDLTRALYSGAALLTLVAQEELQPFRRDASSSRICTHEMHLHDLPWPEGSLEALGGSPVRLRVTLSYFIEPAPGTRPFTKRHQYASHGLRFAVRTANESQQTFLERINKQVREEGALTRYATDSSDWFLGQERNRGSVHSDVWTGTAADLAGKGAVAVYPVRGWWADNPGLERHDSRARYALVVSIETDSETVSVQGIDLYSEVLQKIEVAQQIEV